MPINPTFPGVYIEKIPSPVRTIVGVSTSITAFIGSALKGPMNKPVIVCSFSDFQLVFGGLWKDSSMSFAIYQFFLNGGIQAVVVRVAHSNAHSAVFENNNTNLKFIASSPGSWANDLKISINHEVHTTLDNTNDLFDIVIKEKVGKDLDGKDVFEVKETFPNVSCKEDDGMYFVTVLKEVSNLIFVKESTLLGLPDQRPEVGDFEISASYGDNGDVIDGDDIKGNSNNKSGIYALDNTDLFNLLCIPPPIPLHTPQNFFTDVCAKALDYCKKHRAMLIVDPPSDWRSKDSPLNSLSNFELNKLSLQSENAAIYFPRIKAPDPLTKGRLKSFPPCGVVAGIISKTDSQRGVWKAPAGLETSLTGVPDLEVILTDEENDKLNKMGINCLRTLPPHGLFLWGARTLRGADSLSSQWKYIPVRRTALFIEESLYRGTQWAVFEPNDESLWSQIRLNVGSFMNDLFRQGAFQGSSPKEAYLVKCDGDTTTQNDIDKGIVNIRVGFAPLKPAEFVIIKIQQFAGQV